MNKTSYSQNKLTEEFGVKNNLGDLFKAIENAYHVKGEVVCQFKLNGLVLDEKDESRLANIKPEEIVTLEVESQRPELLLFSVIENWIRELPILIEHTDELSKEIAQNSVEGHLSQFVHLIDSVQLLVDSLISLESVVHTQSFMGEGQWKENKTRTAESITQALNAFESKDHGLLGEILEYELGHSLQVWLDLLKDFYAVLKQSPRSWIK